MNGWLMQAGEWIYALVTSTVFLLTVGGAVGTNLRYFLGKWIYDSAGSAPFPIGTFVINISGSLLVALVALAFPRGQSKIAEQWFLFLGTGFCGGYTTFSAFELETFRLVNDGRWAIAAAYVAASLVAGFLAVAAVFWACPPTTP